MAAKKHIGRAVRNSHETEQANFSRNVKASVETAKTQLADGWGSDFLSQFLGLKSENKGHFSPEQPLSEKTNGPISLFDASKHGKHENSKKHGVAEKQSRGEGQKDAAIHYSKEVADTTKVSRQELREMNGRVQEIMAELKKLVLTSRVLQVEFSDVTTQQTPTKVGQYDVNFLEFVLNTVREARKKVQDSGMWLNAVKGKGGKKRWGNKERKDWFGNTSRSMSNESVVANQTG